MKREKQTGFKNPPSVSRVRIVFMIGEEFARCRLLRKPANLGACIEILGVVFHYRPPEIFRRLMLAGSFGADHG